MKYKSILLFVALVAIIASFNFVSCHKYESESDGYSVWGQLTEADSVIYAKAREAYLDDPANAGSAEFMLLQFAPLKPYAVRTKAVENGMNYQFACKEYFVTVYKSNGDEIGKVIAVEPEPYNITPPPPPSRRDTFDWSNR